MLYASKFSKENSSCIHICWEQLATEHICRKKKKGLGVLVENKLNMRQQCTVVAMKVYQFLDCICKNVGNRLRKEVLSPVFNICEAASGIPCSVLVPLLGELQQQTGTSPAEGH